MRTPPSETHASPMRFVSFRRPIITLRGGDPVHTLLLEHQHKSPPALVDREIESFQARVSTLFHGLSGAAPKDFLSISWIRKLLAAFSACHEEFRSVVSSKKKKSASTPAKQRILTEYFDRTIKALDMLNAARDGLEKINAWQRHLEIVICALGGRTAAVGEGNLRRARKALVDLALEENKDDSAGGGGVFSHRSRSFKRRAAASSKDQQSRPPLAHTRSLSWSVSHSWSASKQLQLLANAVQSPPRAADVAATDGLAALVHTMSFVLVFVLWALVAAVPCQDRGTHTSIVIPRQPWSSPFHTLHARIAEESKRRRRSSNGLLKEVRGMEEGVSHVTEFVESAQLPLSEEHKDELRGRIQELMSVSEVCKTELKPLERDIREVFRKMVTCRVEGLEFHDPK